MMYRLDQDQSLLRTSLRPVLGVDHDAISASYKPMLVLENEGIVSSS